MPQFWYTFTSSEWVNFTSLDWYNFKVASSGLSSDSEILPTITYPNGNEIITSRFIDIEWENPVRPGEESVPRMFEIFFTPEWNGKEDIRWLHIATVSSTVSTFRWTVPYSIRSNRCRIAMRARDTSGIRSRLTISANDFTIQKRGLTSPSVSSPVDGGSYHNYVPIVLDHSGITNTYSQKSTYQIYYSSKVNNIDWTIIRENLPVGTEPFLLDIRDIPPGDDYELKVILLDSDGNSSLPVYIKNLKVRSVDYFLLDTIPPKGTVTIKDNSEYSKNRNLILQLDAFDETTGVKSVTIQQTFDETTTNGEEQEMGDIKSWYLTGDEDGRYCIQSLFKDYAGNVPSTSSLEEIFRSYLNNDNIEITSSLVVNNGTDTDLFVAFGGTEPVLYQNKDLLCSLTNVVNDMTYFDAIVYMAAKTSENKGILQKLENDEPVDIYEFSEVDSVITSMCVFDSMLYLGLQNGSLYSFDGTSVNLVTSFSAQIDLLSSDDRVLYIFLENSENITIYDGSSFVTSEVTNGYIQV